MRRGPGAATAALTVLTLLVSGCGGSTASIKSRFMDADGRVGMSVGGGFSETRRLDVPTGVARLTIKGAFASTQGISYQLTGPLQEVAALGAWPHEASAQDLEWVAVEHPAAGSWLWRIDCPAQCDYAFGFYFQDAVHPGAAGLSERYRDADKRVADDSEAASSRYQEFRVPEGAASLTLHWSAQAAVGLTYVLRDPSGDRVSSISFLGHAAADEVVVRVADAPAEGLWRLFVSCPGPCAYAFGVYAPPQG